MQQRTKTLEQPLHVVVLVATNHKSQRQLCMDPAFYLRKTPSRLSTFSNVASLAWSHRPPIGIQPELSKSQLKCTVHIYKKYVWQSVHSIRDECRIPIRLRFESVLRVGNDDFSNDNKKDQNDNDAGKTQWGRSAFYLQCVLKIEKQTREEVDGFSDCAQGPSCIHHWKVSVIAQ